MGKGGNQEKKEKYEKSSIIKKKAEFKEAYRNILPVE